MAASLPDELLARILSPVDSIKSLVQARAVCKSWKAAVEGDQVRALRASHTLEPPIDPLIALTGGCRFSGKTSGPISRKLSFRIGGDGQWFDGPPMPEPRFKHGVAAIGRKIYIVGGVTLAGQKKIPATRTLVYDVWTASWSDAPGLQVPRQSSVVVALPDGRILVAGGMSRYEPVATCELFDPKTETWVFAAPMAEKRWWAQGAVLDGRAHVVGGRAHGGAGAERRTMEIYDSTADSWDFGVFCPAAAWKGCAAAAGGKLCLFENRSSWAYTPPSEELTVLRRVDEDACRPRPSTLGTVVEVDGHRGRAIGFRRDDEHPTKYRVDVLVTDDNAPPLVWLNKFWRRRGGGAQSPRCAVTLAKTTCVVAASRVPNLWGSRGFEVLLFGGDSELHSYGGLEYHLDIARRRGGGGPSEELMKRKFEHECVDHVSRDGGPAHVLIYRDLKIDPRQDPWTNFMSPESGPLRSLDQSEDAAATAVHM